MSLRESRKFNQVGWLALVFMAIVAYELGQFIGWW